jgi:alginate O-acetyltransferase complex protein AlgI
MPFNSIVFVFFFAAVLALHSLPLPWVVRKLNLLVASYVFYAAWDVRYVALLLFSTAVNGIGAALINRYERPSLRKYAFWTVIILNLGLLGLFKYGNQILALWEAISRRLDIPFPGPAVSIVLPIGLSFFTFQSMSYTIDVYRRTIKPAASILDLGLFVSFFPVLLAGPILRASQFLPQCAKPRRANAGEFGWGLSLFTLGLFLKVALADHLLAPVVNRAYNPALLPDALSAWTGTLAFLGQDYCDFAGYSTCALGIGLCLGFVLPPNFRAPLASIGFRAIWQRWHITLVAWMRDYVFSPLGGVYRGYRRAAINVMIVMLLIGLWHGATASFLIFGFLQGAFLIGETLLQRTRLRRWQVWRRSPGKTMLWAITITLCLISFVFYRSESAAQSGQLLLTMFLPSTVRPTLRLTDFDFLSAWVVIAAIIAAHWLVRDISLEIVAIRAPWWSISISLAVMFVAIALTSGESQTYLYFQY